MARLLSAVGNLVPTALITRLERDLHGKKVIGRHGLASLCRRLCLCTFWKFAGCRLPRLCGLSLDLSNDLDSSTRVRAARRGGEFCANVVQDELPGAPFSCACASVSWSRMPALLRFGRHECGRVACCEARIDVLGQVRVRRFVDEEREASRRRGDEVRELRGGRGVP